MIRSSQHHKPVHKHRPLWQRRGLFRKGGAKLSRSQLLQALVVPVKLLSLLSPPLTAWGQDARAETQRTQRDVRKIERRGPVRTKILKNETRTKDGHEAGTGSAIFMGITGGLLSIETDDTASESAKSGFYLAGKSIFSIYQENWVFDLGLGWFYGQVSSDGDPGTEEIPPDLAPTPIQIGLNAGLLEVAPRFRLSDNWQIGLVADVLASTDDVSFSGLVADIDNPTPWAILGGAQLMYGVPKQQADWRAGIEYLTDLTIDGRQLHFITGTVQFGLPLVSPDTVIKNREVLTQRQRTEIIEKKRLERQVVVKEVVKFVFERKQILFLRNGSVLHPDSQSFLLDLSQLLQQNSHLWESVRVEGHTSAITPIPNARRTSRKRAFNVKAALVGGGIAPTRVQSIGLGSSKPLRPDFPSERDERIVLSFIGVEDLRGLSSAVNSIRKKFHIPETCTDEGCK